MPNARRLSDPARRWAPPAIALVAVAGGSPSAAESASTPTPVTAEVVTGAATIVPGEPFRVGLMLRVAPEWHVYWKHPGDTGMATEVTLEAPDVTWSELLWPAPSRFGQPGDLVGYGYADSVLIHATGTIAESTTRDSVTIDVRGDWLSCRDVCIMGSSATTVTLPVSRTDGPPAANARFSHWLEQVPGSGSPASVDVASVEGSALSSSAATWRVDLDWPGAPPPGVDWIPDPGDAVNVERIRVATSGSRTTITFDASLFAGTSPPDAPMESVIVFGDHHERRGIPLTLDLTRGHPSDAAPAGAVGSTQRSHR